MNSSLIYIVWPTTLIASFVTGGFLLNSAKGPSNHKTRKITQTVTRASPATSNSLASQTTAPHSYANVLADTYSRDYLLQRITRISDPLTRASNMLIMLKTLEANDFQHVVNDFRSLGITRERYGEYQMLMHAWAQVDPKTAMKYAKNETRGGFASQTVLSSWASVNPEDAIQWAKQNHTRDSGNPYMTGVIKGLASNDLTLATELLNNMQYSAQRGDALSAVLNQVEALNQQEAVDWLNSISDERLKSGATSRLAAQLAKSNPKATSVWITSLEDEITRKKAQDLVAESWAEINPNQASQWVSQLNSKEQISAAKSVLPQLAKENNEKAVEWMKTMSGQAGYEQLVTTYIRSVAHSEPAKALAQISEFKDSKTQKQAQNRILAGWSLTAPEKAQQWMDQNSLSDEMRSAISKQAKQRERYVNRRRGRSNN